MVKADVGMGEEERMWEENISRGILFDHLAGPDLSSLQPLCERLALLLLAVLVIQQDFRGEELCDSWPGALLRPPGFGILPRECHQPVPWSRNQTLSKKNLFPFFPFLSLLGWN